jgi:glycogen(starch) synthase
VHVLITADTIGGVWTYTRELVCGLLSRGHQVTLVSLGRHPTPAQSFWLNQKRLACYPTEFPLEWMQNVQAGIVESARFLNAIIHEVQPDILHFSQYCYGGLECGIPKVVVAHSDVVSWWHAVHGSSPPQSDWLDWYTTLVSRGLRCADAVVAPSGWMLDAICQYYEPPAKSCVIYNGRSAGLFRPTSHKTDCVLAVGRIWDEAKQIKLLLARKHCVPIRIAGSAQHPEKTASSCSVEAAANLTFCGEQDERNMCELYSDSATYAATSRYEPFGLAALEAALSRCALIANDIPVFRELWGGSALYFERNSPDGLAKAIQMLSENALLRQFYAEQAYEWARSRFNSCRMVSEYENLYRSLVGGRARA